MGAEEVVNLLLCLITFSWNNALLICIVRSYVVVSTQYFLGCMYN